MLALQEVRQNMELCIDFLDKEIPDWWKNVDVKKLHMINPCRCITGQNKVSFIQFINKLAEAYPTIESLDCYFACFDEYWIGVILRRQWEAETYDKQSS